MPINKDRILYLDDYLLAVNKLSGELVVKAPGQQNKLPLFDFLKKDYPGLSVLHRLDFETSGVIIFARNKNVLNKAKEQMPTWKKTYRALVAGHLKDKNGVIDEPLPARGKDIKVPAKTIYRVINYFKDCTYVEAEILTGRQHQIRRHFAGINHPLILDSRYGNFKDNKKITRRLGFKRFFLHAWKIELNHPFLKEPLIINAPLPPAFTKILNFLQ